MSDAHTENRVPAGSRGEVLFSAESLSIGYSGKAILPPVNFKFCRGTTTALLGRNGSGKSTLMKTLLGSLKPVSGAVIRPFPKMKVALMPQTRDLDFQLPVTVREFVSWGALSRMNFLKRPWTIRSERDRVDESLRELGLDAIGGRFLNELSEGQQQRVLFARVLATEADAALLDEPTAAMDAVFQKDVIQLLGRLAKERNMAVIVITHALELVGELADSVIFLDSESGTVSCGEKNAILSGEAFLGKFVGVRGTGKSLQALNSQTAPEETTGNLSVDTDSRRTASFPSDPSASAGRAPSSAPSAPNDPQRGQTSGADPDSSAEAAAGQAARREEVSHG